MLRKIIIAGIILLVLSFAYNLLVQITNALRSGERLSAAADTLYQLEAKNRQLRQRLAEIQSAEFIEEQARNKLGLGKSGETMVIIPQERLKLVMGASQSGKVVRLPNFLGWWKVFF